MCVRGERLDRFYITTSRHGLRGDAEPLAGAVFVADVGVTRLETLRYLG